MSGRIRALRLFLALLFIPRRLRASTMGHWIAELEKDVDEMRREAFGLQREI